VEAIVKIPLEGVERAITKLWEEEATKSSAPRLELMTVVALVSDPGLLDRAKKAVSDLVCSQAARTIVAVAYPSVAGGGGEAEITAEASLHRRTTDSPARGDAIVLEATGAAREWLPENVDRLALPDLPVCIWWVGDLPDYDDLFDRLLGIADVVVVNSCEMDLRDLEKLDGLVARSRDRFALSDLTWFRLRPLQELIARFFDDDSARACLSSLSRVRITFTPRENEQDAASTQAGLLFGWIVHALGLPTDPAGVRWHREPAWSEATVCGVIFHFDREDRPEVPCGTILGVRFECESARFAIERQKDDPDAFRWSREVPGVATPAQTFRVAIHDESTLLIRCLERPKHDRLLEASLHAGSRAVRPVAPRLSSRPGAG
jgi:glucose-6-phosphate dehydrogenase assembly protein OpcA